MRSPETVSLINLIAYFPGFIVADIRNIWATTDPLPTHEDMMNGRGSRREWTEEGAIDLIILL